MRDIIDSELDFLMDFIGGCPRMELNIGIVNAHYFLEVSLNGSKNVLSSM